ncbi:MAG: glycerophosphodiester phosphodiesterase [Clostridia bacterium]|nr:glycerophosphodiester phosphodiesterase [Clostridia bacterium]
MKTKKIHKPLIYAHRGASADAPENTMASFELAAQYEADGIELDVILTKDGEVVVIHDDDVDRTSNGKGTVEQMYYSDIKALDFGSWKGSEFKGEKIPLLTDVCRLVKDKNMLLNIEIKPTVRSSEIEDKVISICKSMDLVDQVVISSFNHYCMRSIKKKFSKLETAILYQSGIMKAGRYARHTVKADGIHPHKYAVVAECVKSAALNGIKIRPWTVDSPAIFQKMAGIKYITGVITNRPDIMRKALNEITNK